MTVYITHYANDDLTYACYDAWREQTDDIVIIDNGSPVPLTQRCKVRICRLEQNLHLIPANNAGMQMFPSPWYFNVNNDVFPGKGCLKRMLQVFEDPEIGIAAPGTSDDCAGTLCVTDWNADRRDRLVDNLDNHAWMFMPDLIDEIGWPDADRHPHRANWYANKLYCWKARQAGYKILAVRSAFVDHRRSKGFDAEAHYAGQAWLEMRMGERIMEAG